jgi:hypothetical protein
MAIDAQAKAYWTAAADAIDAQVTGKSYTAAKLRTFLGKLPIKIPDAAIVCREGAATEEWALELWDGFSYCVRAIRYMLDGTGYVSRESMDLRCILCQRFAGCPVSAEGVDKIKYCVGTLKVIADTWRVHSV